MILLLRKKSVATAVESVIDKEANKSKSDFKVGNFTAAELRQKLLNIEDAKAGNLRDAVDEHNKRSTSTTNV